MQLAVWDTHVTRADGSPMHFDVLVAPGTPFDTVAAHGRAYLQEKGEPEAPLTTRECRLCHIEEATPDMAASVEARGYAVIELEGC